MKFWKLSNFAVSFQVSTILSLNTYLPVEETEIWLPLRPRPTNSLIGLLQNSLLRLKHKLETEKQIRH